jgi:hypothetical protein
MFHFWRSGYTESVVQSDSGEEECWLLGFSFSPDHD